MGRPRSLKGEDVTKLSDKILPYKGKDDLPPPIVSHKEGRQDKFVKVGGYRYECHTENGKTFLVSVSRKMVGVCRKLVKILYHKKPQDLIMRKQLREAGIPGA